MSLLVLLGLLWASAMAGLLLGWWLGQRFGFDRGYGRGQLDASVFPVGSIARTSREQEPLTAWMAL